MKAVLLLATLALASAKHYSFDLAKAMIELEQSTLPVDPSIQSFSASSRGLIEGYYQGMYKSTNFTLSPLCFGSQAQQDIQAIKNVRKLFEMVF